MGQSIETSFRSENEFKVWVAQQQRIEELESRVKVLENNSRAKIGMSVQICDLNNPKYILKKPISLLVFTENGEYYASLVDFDVFGVGENEISAIDDLKGVIVVYFDSLKVSRSKLSDKLKAKFNLLQSFISNET